MSEKIAPRKRPQGQIRVLQIVGAMAPGGLENFIMNLYEHIDREAVQFDFAVHAHKPGGYEERIEALGGRIYDLPRLTAHPVGNLRQLYDLVKQNQYPVVIRHTANALITPQLLAAKKAGAFTVCHAHSVDDPMKALHYAGRALMPWAADDRMACSEQAGRWMYGGKDCRVIRNAIDIEAFQYNPEAEARIRWEFSLGDAHVFGHVGNFNPVKNHEYLLKVFSGIAANDEKARLLCVGDGPLRNAIEEKIEEMHLKGKVILTGTRNDVSDILSAMDVMLFPSVFEGIPVSLIEAQASGLPCIISDAVAAEIEVTSGLIHFLSIHEDPKIWTAQAMDIMESITAADKHYVRRPQREAISQHGYDIDELGKWYQEYILHIAEKQN